MKNELNIAPATGIAPTARRPKKPPGRKGKVITVVIIALAALTAGVVVRPAPTEVTEASLASSEPTESEVPGTATSEPATLPTPSPEPTPEPEPEGPALLDGIVPLDLETQTEIWEICGEDQRIFCMVMAIAEKETRFDPEAVGDNGRSIGLMQINTRWQYDRIEKLGITDLTDPAQNVAVGIDYIDWLARHINPDDPESTYGSAELFIAYNSGLNGAQGLWDAGIYETDYSRDTVESYWMFMGMVEVSER